MFCMSCSTVRLELVDSPEERCNRNAMRGGSSSRWRVRLQLGNEYRMNAYSEVSLTQVTKDADAQRLGAWRREVHHRAETVRRVTFKHTYGPQPVVECMGMGSKGGRASTQGSHVARPPRQAHPLSRSRSWQGGGRAEVCGAGWVSSRNCCLLLQQQQRRFQHVSS